VTAPAVAVYRRGLPDAACGRCQWWQPDRGPRGLSQYSGTCRSRPPHSAHGWPETDASDWCQSFKAAPVETPAEARVPEGMVRVGQPISRPDPVIPDRRNP